MLRELENRNGVCIVLIKKELDTIDWRMFLFMVYITTFIILKILISITYLYPLGISLFYIASFAYFITFVLGLFIYLSIFGRKIFLEKTPLIYEIRYFNFENMLYFVLFLTIFFVTYIA